jgi:predicted phage-related endonuclease
MAKAKNNKINHAEMAEKIRAIRQLQKSVKTLEEKIEENKNYVTSVMKEHGLDSYDAGDFTANYKDVNKSTFDKQRFENDYPGLYDKYMKRETAKRFSIS